MMFRALLVGSMLLGLALGSIASGFQPRTPARSMDDEGIRRIAEQHVDRMAEAYPDADG